MATLRSWTLCVALATAGCAHSASVVESGGADNERSRCKAALSESAALGTGLWRAMRPLELLGCLATATDKYEVELTVLQGATGWVRAEDVLGLAALLDSRKPCPHVKTGASSHWATHRSFIGQEALFMIEGYRKGMYPPKYMHHSHDFYERHVQEIRAWLREWRSLGP